MTLAREDLKAISDLMDGKLSNLEQRLTADTESKLSNLEQRLTADIKNSIHESEVIMLDEMERHNKNNEKKFDIIDKRLSRMEDTVNTIKLEYDIVNILVRQIKDLELRISIIENKIA